MSGRSSKTRSDLMNSSTEYNTCTIHPLHLFILIYSFIHSFIDSFRYSLIISDIFYLPFCRVVWFVNKSASHLVTPSGTMSIKTNGKRRHCSSPFCWWRTLRHLASLHHCIIHSLSVLMSSYALHLDKVGECLFVSFIRNRKWGCVVCAFEWRVMRAPL